jgi:hypothetical protein
VLPIATYQGRRFVTWFVLMWRFSTTRIDGELQSCLFLGLLLLALFGVALFSHAEFASKIEPSSTAFAYDGRGQLTNDYDDNSKSGFVYDAGTVLAVGGKRSGATGERDLSGKFAQLLAAKSRTNVVYQSFNEARGGQSRGDHPEFWAKGGSATRSKGYYHTTHLRALESFTR